MSAPDKTIELSDGRTLKVYHEEDADDPRSWDNLGTMVCMHRRYTLGDKHSYNESDFTSWTDLERRIIEDHDPVVIMPLFMMDHSGLSIRAGRGFGDCDPQGWDWGQIGFIFVGRRAAAEEFGTLDGPETIEKIRRCLLAEVNVYDKFLRGDVWGYILEGPPDECEKCGHRERQTVDSCWGFYGWDPADSGMLDSLPEEIRGEVMEEWQPPTDPDGGIRGDRPMRPWITKLAGVVIVCLPAFVTVHCDSRTIEITDAEDLDVSWVGPYLPDLLGDS